MKEKFVRTSEHKKISDIEVNHSSEYTSSNIAILKQMQEILKEAHAEGLTKNVNLEDIQMASDSEHLDITIDNAHKHIKR